MHSDDQLLTTARQVLRIEAEGLECLAARLDMSFCEAVRLLDACRGKVILTGMGKSGHIARKVSATLASTGTPSFYLHPGEAAHGDLGRVTGDDLVLALSNSGQTQELLVILPRLRGLGVRLIALVGRPDSALGRAADVTLDAGVEREACPLNLVPTSSTTAALALGDALAVALMELRGFRPDDFARFHPGGRLGERLLSLRVRDVLLSGESFPQVPLTADFSAVVAELSAKRQGVTAVTDESGRLAGVISNGDILRLIAADGDYRRLTAADIMSRAPKTITPDATADQAVALMETHNITALVVTDNTGHPLGLVHLHDLLGRRQFWQPTA